MKKKWIVLTALTAVLAAILVTALIVGGIVFIRGGSGDNNNSSNEADTATIGTIRAPGNDNTTKIIFTHPPELEGKWEKPTVSDYAINIAGQITNISNQSVSFEMYFIYDGESWGSTFPRTLRPGETVKVDAGQLVAPFWGKKVLEIKAVIQKPATTVPPTTTPPATPLATAPPETETPETQVFTSAPKNPRTPEEVLVAFYFYAYAGEIQKALNLVIEKDKARIEAELKSLPQKELLKIGVESIYAKDNEAYVGLTWYFEDYSEDVNVRLIKEDNAWKIKW